MYIRRISYSNRVCLYLHTYILNIYIHTYTHIHTHTYIHIHTYIYTYIHTYIYIHSFIHTYIHTYIYTYKHIQWLAWLTSNCGQIGAIGSSPSNGLKQTCETKKDLIPCASALTSMYVQSNPTYKQYIDVVIHQIHTHTYIYYLHFYGTAGIQNGFYTV